MDFFAAGKNSSQRILFGGNRTRKTGTGLFEFAAHVTGLYHSWWPGYRFNHPIKAWVVGVTSEDTLDVLQLQLVGDEFANLQGLIPRHLIVNVTYKYKSAIRTMYVKHFDSANKLDGYSVVTFKSDSEGRKKFQGRHIHLIHLDEEMSDGVFEESLTRTMETAPDVEDGKIVSRENGLLIKTFTPLSGKTPLVRRLTEKVQAHRYVETITWDDCPHLTEDVKRELLESYHPHTRDARSRGIPNLGSGIIFDIPVERVFIKPIRLPDHWFRFYGLDLGWHNTSAVFIAHDRDTDIMYVYNEFIGEKQIAAVNASSIKALTFGGKLVGVADTSIMQINPLDGRRLIEEYEREGLRLIKPYKVVEAGIQVLWQRFRLGTLKIFDTCQHLKTEYENYHRDENGKIKKAEDHLVDALRYAAMSGVSSGVSKYAIDNPNDIENYIPENKQRMEIDAYTGL
jgi:phage terminase large subunit-like protein